LPYNIGQLMMEQKRWKNKSAPVKALHIKIDQIQQTVTRRHIEYLYSSKAMVFLLGFKMQLVQDHWLLTNMQAKEKAASFCAHQARFLAQMENCSTWEPATINLIGQQMQATLHQNIMNILDPMQLACKLFHAINKMYIRDGFIFQFHPSHSQQVREVMARLLVF